MTHVGGRAKRLPVRWVLWLSVPIALLGTAASAAGVLFSETYAQETPIWAAQASGQDAVNLLVFPAMLLLAGLAARGSLRAYLAWLGTLLYSSYSYAFYAGYAHFGPLFPVYVAVLGLSAYALVGGVTALKPQRVRDAFGAGTPVRLVGGFLLAVGTLFYVLEMSQVVAAIRAGTAPPGALDAGMPVDPVHVLDMAFLLPAMLITGVLLLRRRSLGFCLAAPILAHLVALNLAILSMVGTMAMRELPFSWGMVGIFGASTTLSLGLLLRFLAGVRSEVSLREVFRGSAEPGGVSPRQPRARVNHPIPVEQS